MHAYAYVCRKCDAYTRSGSGVDSVGDGLHAGYGVEGGERGGGQGNPPTQSLSPVPGEAFRAVPVACLVISRPDGDALSSSGPLLTIPSCLPGERRRRCVLRNSTVCSRCLCAIRMPIHRWSSHASNVVTSSSSSGPAIWSNTSSACQRRRIGAHLICCASQ